MPTRSDHVVFAIPLDFVMYVELDTLGVEWEIEINGRPASIKFPALPEMQATGELGSKARLACRQLSPRGSNSGVS